MKKKLGKSKQCDKCPWKVSTNPRKIPNGYSVKKHKALKKTINNGLCSLSSSMACHESEKGKESHCIGWLANQLGSGNNISLRLQMLDYDLSDMQTVGQQHERFEDTLP